MSLAIHPDSRPQAEAYDALPYQGRPCPESHPSRLAVQAKLLRVFETMTFTRLGGTKPIRVNVRLIVAQKPRCRTLTVAT